MQSNTTKQKMGLHLRKLLTAFLLIICAVTTKAQTTITTVGTGYDGNLGIIGGDAAIVFGVQNTNAGTRTLTAVDVSWNDFFTAGAVTATLWYSTTSLSGAPTIATPAWTQIATANLNIVGAPGIIPTFTGLSFVLAANTQYRFAVSTNNGIGYSSAAATPNLFSAGGVNLQTSNFQIGGANVGYAGAFPSPPNNPRAFTGAITFVNNDPPCSGTPDPGNTISSVTSVCATINFDLSVENNPPVSGLTYQWQSSSTLGGPYTNIGGATNSTLTTSQTADTYYQAIVTCGANSATSVPVFVPLSASSGCYCLAGSPDVVFEKIGNVKYNTIDNTSTSTGPYENFTAISTSVVQQSSKPITITIDGGFDTDQAIVWIDFNHNGNFTDPGEKVFTSAEGVGPHTGNLTIPATSLLGPTRMRIRLFDSFFDPSPTSCGDTDYGQVEDYTIDIQPCIQGVIEDDPEDATTSCGAGASFSVGATGSDLTYRWEQRVDASAPWTNVTNGGVFSDATTATLVLTKVPESMNGYQYRALVEGPCTAIIATGVATLTVTPLIAIVDPVDPEICNGSIQQLTITNTEPNPSFCSGPISVAIPDGVFPGPYAASTSTITVAGVPGSAVVTKLNVTLNITHAYVGDLVIVLKSPSGKIFNLDALLTYTNNGEVDFVNTVISSAGTAALGTGIGPLTGTFAPDGAGPTFDFAGFDLPGGPTGFTPNATTMAELFATDVNGDWTLAMYDAGAPDEGELTSWCLDFTYGAASTGVFGPIGQVGTIWTDPAATIPYDGTSQINTVYVNPTVSTTYNVVVTTSTCVSDPLPINVTVSSPVSNVSTVANASGCIDGDATFTVTADGAVLHYQWQESTDGGTTWNDLADGGIYSGTTTGTLSLSGLSDTEDGNLYRVIVSTACNTITSNEASLAVNAVPTVTIATTTTQLYPGVTTTLTSTVSTTGSTYQWYKNGVAIPGATGSTLLVDIDGLGDYTLVAGDVNACSNTSNTITISSTPNDILFIYPSPNTGQFQVRYQSAAGNVLPRMLTIYDSKGARIYTKEYIISAPYGKMEVNLGHLSKGVYRVELADRNGRRIKTGSVLIL